MEEKQARKLISGLTYNEKILLRELLLSLKQNQQPEQLHQESDPIEA